MPDKILTFFVKHRGIISYLFFGTLTTLVNFAVFISMHNQFGLCAVLSNGIAWAVSVMFAYLTNKQFVFKSHDWSLSVLLPEFGRFLGCRLGSGIAETYALFLLADLMGLNGGMIKIFFGAIVFVLNYAGSKLLVFKR